MDANTQSGVLGRIREGAAVMSKMTIGVISDTHGLVRPEIFDIFAKVDLIIHAGDIGNLRVLSDLNAIAPVKAVLGNMDFAYSLPKLKLAESFELLGHKIYLIHNRLHLTADPVAEGISLVIFGHTHIPYLQRVNGVVYFNPGSAGPKRPGKPIAAGIITLAPDAVEARHIMLGP